MSAPTEWPDGLAEALAQPFDSSLIQTKKQGGTTISFVAWHHYVRRLNALVGPEGWSMGEPIVKEVGGKLVIGLPVTILGTTKINFGDEDEEKDSFGSAVTNAYAQALKRTLALFGVGLDMYGGHTAPKQARAKRAPSTPKETGEVATEKQTELIKRLAKSHHVEADLRVKVSAALPNMTKKRASEVIDHLQGLIDAGAAAEGEEEPAGVGADDDGSLPF